MAIFDVKLMQFNFFIFAVMQFNVLLVEDLDDRPSEDNKIVFPNYTNPDVAKWSDARDEISFPVYQLSESIRKSNIFAKQ